MLPLVAFVPLQPPDAVHVVALLALQFRVAALPLGTLFGLAPNVTAGAGVVVPVVTVTDVVALLMPPGPVQDSMKLAVAVRAAVGWLPLVATVPLQAPEAVQEVAFVELQLMVELPPDAMLAGEALRDSVGAGVEVGVEADPPPQEASAYSAAMPRPAAAIRVKVICRFELFICI